MSYRNTIPDILPGSVWIGANGCRVTVVQAAARYVVVRREAVMETMHERDFRAAFTPLYERAKVRQQFSMSAANLGEFRVYWLPEQRRIVARSISCNRHFAVPAGALEVGVYSAPCSITTFFEDLDETIARGQSAQRAAARAILGG